MPDRAVDSIVGVSNCDFYAVSEVVSDSALVINQDGYVSRYEKLDEDATGPLCDLGGLNVSPGLVDIQVNGAEGQWVWDCRSTVDFARIDRALLSNGVTRWCPTFMSPSTEEIERAVDLSAEALCTGLGVIGWHFEGPWIADDQRGAHPSERIRRLLDRELYHMVNLARVCPVIVTLAPELVPASIVKALASSGVKVLAGHTNARMKEYEAFFNAGGHGLSKIGNSCGLLESREAYGLGALLDRPTKVATCISDGFHISPATISVLKRSLRAGQLMAVSNLTAGPSDGNCEFDLLGARCRVGQDGTFCTADGSLAGASVPLFGAVRRLVQSSGIPLDEALRMCSLYPAQLLGVDNKIGSLRPGCAADFVSFSNYFVIGKVYRQGREIASAVR